MTTQSAIIVQMPGHAALVRNVPIPPLRDGYILVRVKSVAVNPTDWRHVDYVPCSGCIVGCDYAGIVEAIGPNVQKSFQSGDRVAGFVHGSNATRPDGGAFAEYIVAKADLQLRVPEFMSLDAAATLGVGLTTVGQNLYQSLKLPIPGEGVEDTSILIYGGATATGSLAIQFAKLSGLQVYTTCSENNRAFMYELGADFIFDYKEGGVGAMIREHSGDTIELALDTISTPQSAAICADAISSVGGCYNAILEVKCPRQDVDSHVSMAYDIIGEPYRMGATEVEGKRENLEFGVKWCEVVERLLQAGRVTPHRHQVKAGGLQGVLDGMQLLRQGKVRGHKLVYRVEETEAA